jgi:hypothetical protein
MVRNISPGRIKRPVSRIRKGAQSFSIDDVNIVSYHFDTGWIPTYRYESDGFGMTRFTDVKDSQTVIICIGDVKRVIPNPSDSYR